jgi:hypothetical protein
MRVVDGWQVVAFCETSPVIAYTSAFLIAFLQISASVLLCRPAAIAAAMTEKERRFHDLQRQVEEEQALLSDFDLRRINERRYRRIALPHEMVAFCHLIISLDNPGLEIGPSQCGYFPCNFYWTIDLLAPISLQDQGKALGVGG